MLQKEVGGGGPGMRLLFGDCLGEEGMGTVTTQARGTFVRSVRTLRDWMGADWLSDHVAPAPPTSQAAGPWDMVPPCMHAFGSFPP